ncbi:type IV pilin N-terminal domain-containing protein [Haloarcula sediminis]|uniref:type IV pilin N-terminal domain-containing protein n=1 Tax=Haloarcula sediminis TaxID=3111777 RepID=UPI002D797A61|nr:type IV pilin N-terminal domain-containing protein [Haloarcula sp. CK38]
MQVPTSERGVTPVVSNLLLVAIVVILAAVVSVFALGVAEDTNEAGPVVSESSGEFVAGGNRTDQVVRISHVAGDDVPVESIEIVVRAPDCDTEARLVDLPSSGDDNTIDSSHIEGDTSLIDKGPGQAGDLIGSETNNVFTAGETIEFRVAIGGCDFRVAGNDSLTVLVVHTRSDSILIEKELRA